MTRKHITLIFAGPAFMCLVLATLYALSPLSKKIDPSTSSFARRFGTTSTLKEISVTDLGYDSYYIAGMTDDKIYLGNYSSPLHMAIATPPKKIQPVQLQVPELDSIVRPDGLRTVVDPPYFYVTHGIRPGLFRGTLNQWTATHFMPDSAYFVEAVPMSANTFALKSYNNKTEGYELALETADSPYFEFKTGLLEKQAEGIFSVEGKLHYSKESHQLVYLYTYRNQYVVLDEQMNLKHRFNTIDTFSQAKIKVSYIKSENTSMLASPRINNYGQSSLANELLYVQSNLLAKNDNMEKFENGVVVDVYNIRKGRYEGSFYVDNYKGSRLTDFKVTGNKLAAIFGQRLVLYELTPEPPTSNLVQH